MNTVKHLNDSKSLPLQKRRLTFWNKNSIAAAVLAALLGTYLDLYFVGKGLYLFPQRPLPGIFSINITFTLFILPCFVMFFLYYLSWVHIWGRTGIVLLISLLMPILEKLAEKLGFFTHSDKWHHLYTFFGYILFLSLIATFYHWMGKRPSR